MTPPHGLFRQEALEFHTGQTRPGGVLRVDTAWTRWSFWMVLALVAVGVIVTATVHTAETTSGSALVDVRARTFVALVPDAASGQLRRGQPVRLYVPGHAAEPVAGRAVSSTVADRAGIRRAGFRATSQPGVLVTGVLASGAGVSSSARLQGRAVIVVGSRTILALFLDQLRGSLGQGGG